MILADMFLVITLSSWELRAPNPESWHQPSPDGATIWRTGVLVLYDASQVFACYNGWIRSVLITDDFINKHWLDDNTEIR